MNRAIFFDRDGTVNVEVDFLTSPQDLILLPGAADAVREATAMGFKTIVITNQSGIARGLLTETQLGDIHSELKKQLELQGAYLDAIYYCPHHPEDGTDSYRATCDCRKPNIGMLTKAAAEFELDLKRSFVIGDRMRDVEAARNAGATPILVLTGYGEEEVRNSREQGAPLPLVANSIFEAMQQVKRIAQQEQLSPSH